MITEDYVSYEIAQLLKEKGVDFIDCVTYYCEDKPKEVDYSFCGETNSTWEKRCCQAPTHQMTLKWLREVHNIIVYIKPLENGNCYVSHILYNGVDSIVKGGAFGSYEQAIEAALLYILKNLI